MKTTACFVIFIYSFACLSCADSEKISEKTLQRYTLAKKEYAAGNLPEAERALRTLADEAPNFRRGRFMLAKTVFFRDRADEAADLLEALLEESPEYREAELFLIRILILEEQYAEAALRTERLLSLDAEDPMLLHFRGMICEQEKSLSEAMHYYRKASLACERYARIFLDLGRIYHIFGLQDSAVETLQKCSMLIESNTGAKESVDRMIDKIERSRTE
jgi:Flp pilus assembly protein TadD